MTLHYKLLAVVLLALLILSGCSPCQKEAAHVGEAETGTRMSADTPASDSYLPIKGTLEYTSKGGWTYVQYENNEVVMIIWFGHNSEMFVRNYLEKRGL